VKARETLDAGSTAGPEGREVAQAVQRPASPGYQRPLPGNWWLRNRRYFLYMVREFTAIPITVWMLWFLVEIARVRGGAAGYQPARDVPFVVFSIVCLVFALWHSFTFLRFSGLIMRIPLGERFVPAGAIVAGSFALLFVATVVIGGVAILSGR
jgi:fumarate reductase subunit C